MKKPEHHIDPDELKRYLNNGMSERERNAFEQQLEKSGFDLEAMEGLERLSGEEFMEDLQTMESALTARTGGEQKSNVRPFYWRIAAAILLLATAGFLIIRYSEEFFTPRLTEPQELSTGADSAENQEEAITLLERKSAADSSTAEISDTTGPNEAPEETTEVQVSEAEPGEGEPIADIRVAIAAGATENEASDLEEEREKAAAEEAAALGLAEARPMTLREADSLGLTDAADSIVPPQAIAEELQGRAAGITATESRSRKMARQAEAPAAGAVAEITAEEDIPADRLIRGVVYDGETGSPVPGASIVIPGTSRGTVTDIDGRFELPVDLGDNELTVSFIGYIQTTEDITDTEMVDIYLEQDVSELSEVVVTGYGSYNWEPVDEEITYAYPEDGKFAFNRYIRENIRYPEQAVENDVSGRVVLRFTIGTDGKPRDFEVLRSLGYGCDEEAIRLIREGPDWIPKMVNSAPTEDEVRMTIRFRKRDQQ